MILIIFAYSLSFKVQIILAMDQVSLFSYLQAIITKVKVMHQAMQAIRNQAIVVVGHLYFEDPQ
jgi:hypothetical protein